MAIYHLHAQIIGRGTRTQLKADGSAGTKAKSSASVVASAAYRAGALLTEYARDKEQGSILEAAAYRAGEQLREQRAARHHDYRFKSGVAHAEIMLPPHAPPAYRDRETLWNAVERVETQANAQLAREFNMALPTELTRRQQIRLAREYIQQNFVSRGMCADWVLHDLRGLARNPHIHIMLTMRPLNSDGSWGAKARKEYVLDLHGNHILDKNDRWQTRKIDLTGGWNEKDTFLEWRKSWADLCNRYLADAGRTERITHESYKTLGLDLIPTKHMGKNATAIERKGGQTLLGEYNRDGARRNLARIQALVPFRLVTAAELVTQKVLERANIVAEVLDPQPVREPEGQGQARQQPRPSGHSAGIEAASSEHVQRRTYTPASGVVRQGSPLHPDRTIFEPPDARKQVPRDAENGQQAHADAAFVKRTLHRPIRAAQGEIRTQPADLKSRTTVRVRLRAERSTLGNIQSSARILRFIRDYDIKSLPHLEREIRAGEQQLRELRDSMNAINREITVLSRLKGEAAACRNLRGVVEQYHAKTLFKKEFYDKNRDAIARYYAARDRLKRDGRFDERADPQDIQALIDARAADRQAATAEWQQQLELLELFRTRRVEICDLLDVPLPDGWEQRVRRHEPKTMLEYKIAQAATRETDRPGSRPQAPQREPATVLEQKLAQAKEKANGRDGNPQPSGPRREQKER